MTVTHADAVNEPILRHKGTGTTLPTTGDNALYHHRNQQYSIIGLTNAAGTLVERYSYTAYGTLGIYDASGTVRTNSTYANRYTYTGREYDADLNLYHFRARWYDPTTGGFISRDPLGYVDGMSLYRGYFGARGLDPSGAVLINCECQGLFGTYNKTTDCGGNAQGCCSRLCWSTGNWWVAGAIDDGQNGWPGHICAILNEFDNLTGLNKDAFECLCGMGHVVDLFPHTGDHPIIEAMDCLCGFLSVLRTLCRAGVTSAIMGSFFQFLDCVSSAPGRFLGCLAFGEVFAGMGAVALPIVGAVPGAAIGCIVGLLNPMDATPFPWLGPTIDATATVGKSLFCADNEFTNAGNGLLGCGRVFDAIRGQFVDVAPHVHKVPGMVMGPGVFPAVIHRAL